MKTTDAGYINKNNQKNLGYRGISETHYNQKFFEMECLDCGHKYMANGCDVWLRKCPNCQNKKADPKTKIESNIIGSFPSYKTKINKNSENPKVGREFQEKVKRWFETNTKSMFELERPIFIGNPAKLHKFDIAEKFETIVIECKSYTYTISGNIPSAKLTNLNQAVFYFSLLPAQTEKILVMAYAVHPKRRETLAEYYYRINRHLLSDVKVLEFNIEANEMRKIND